MVVMEITAAGSVRVTEVPAAPEWWAATPQSFSSQQPLFLHAYFIEHDNLVLSVI